MKARAARSASAVTLHVLTITTSASVACCMQCPAARRRSLTASPSARAALQPKCSTWNPGMI
jgi:hypothetical protein